MGAPGADGREGKLEDTDIQNFLNLFNFQCLDFQISLAAEILSNL